MARVPKITPASDLREDVADVLRRAQESREPQVIIQGDERPAVVMSSGNPNGWSMSGRCFGPSRVANRRSQRAPGTT
jgi:hypothetical protein